MPLGLLLQETVYTFRWGARRLEPWSHLVRVEEILIRRARGAFLGHWFGRGLPLKGARLRIVIDNLDALRARWLAAKESADASRAAAEAGGVNLAEPVSGLAGQLMGMLLSPAGFVLGVSVILRNIRYWVKTLYDALGWKVALLLAWPAGGAIIGAFAPIGAGVGIALGANESGDARKARNLVAFLGALAPLIQAATRFIALLLGPREKVRNPVVRALLEFLDALAALAPFVLAAVAVALVEIGPLIVPLAHQLKAFMSLFSEFRATLSDIFGDVRADREAGAKSLPDVFGRIAPIVLDKLDFVFVQLSLTFPVLDMMLTSLWDELIASFTPIVEKATKAISDWKTRAVDAFKDALKADAVAKTIANAKEILSLAAKAWPGQAMPDLSDAALAAAKKAIAYSPPGLAAKGAAEAAKGAYDIYDNYFSAPSRSAGDIFAFPELPGFGAAVARKGGPPPGLDAIGVLARIDIKHGGALSGGYAPVGKGVDEGADAAARPTQVFAAERMKLRRELGNISPAQALADMRDEQMGLRGMLKSVVGRVLPAEMRVHMETLLDAFIKVDEALFLKTTEKESYFPVRDLPDNGQLRPIVRTLTIKGAGVSRADADTFRQLLQKALNALAYPAVKPTEPVATAGGF